MLPDDVFLFHAPWLLHPFEQEHLVIARQLAHHHTLFIRDAWFGQPGHGSEDGAFANGAVVPRTALLIYFTYAIPFLIYSYVFFTGGMYFCWRVVLPVAFRFFFNYAAGMKAGVTVNPTLMLNDFIGLSVKMMAAFGLAFQLPLVACLLTIARVVDWRMLVKHTRWAIVAAFVVGGGAASSGRHVTVG